MLDHEPVSEQLMSRLFYEHAVWEWKFCWWPTRCARSGEFIWLRYAYRGSVYYENLTGVKNPRPILTRRWLTTEEYIIGALKGTV